MKTILALVRPIALLLRIFGWTAAVAGTCGVCLVVVTDGHQGEFYPVTLKPAVAKFLTECPVVADIFMYRPARADALITAAVLALFAGGAWNFGVSKAREIEIWRENKEPKGTPLSQVHVRFNDGAHD